MGEFLTKKQREELKFCHRIEDKLRYGDRIKAVLLLDAGWSYSEIAEALLLDEKSIRNYKKLYEENGVERLCDDNFRGGLSFLSEEEQEQLKAQLKQNLYSTTAEIISHVEDKYGVNYSTSGMADLLRRIGFVYKKTKLVPGKADPYRQEEFLERLDDILNSKKDRDKVYYLDGVHPQHNSQVAYGWIEKGEEKKLKSNTGRKRININGALDSETHEVIVSEDSTLNADSTINLLKLLEEKNPKSSKIYAIVDNARYYKNKDVSEYLQSSKVELVFLPPYAPNLNLIERLWKFFKKTVLANKYYEHFEDFRKASMLFFKRVNSKKYETELSSLLTKNFNIVSAN